MNSKIALEQQLQALQSLLDHPRPDEQPWADRLLTTLESVYELAMHPGAPVSAASRGNLSIAA